MKKDINRSLEIILQETCLNWTQIWPSNFFQQQDHHYCLSCLPVKICQNQRNLMIQTKIIDQKPQIWANLGAEIFFFEIWASSLLWNC